MESYQDRAVMRSYNQHMENKCMECKREEILLSFQLQTIHIYLQNMTFVCNYLRFKHFLDMIWRKLAVLSLNSANLKVSGFSAKN